MANDVTLLFNGDTLLISENGQTFAAFNAVSGRPDYTSPKFQSVSNVGPIPEGTYTTGPVLEASNFGALRGFLQSPIYWVTGSGIGGGEWAKGGPMAWGWQRIDLFPDDPFATFGRTKMSTHGGWYAGSAGCIGLNERMAAFAEIIEKYGPGGKLIVDYDWRPPQHCFPSFTPIHISPTETAHISTLKFGDVVLAFDPKGGSAMFEGDTTASNITSLSPTSAPLVAARVTRLFNNVTDEWLVITAAESECERLGIEAFELTVTPGHEMLDAFGRFRTALDIVSTDAQFELR